MTEFSDMYDELTMYDEVSKDYDTFTLVSGTEKVYRLGDAMYLEGDYTNGMTVYHYKEAFKSQGESWVREDKV